MDWKNTLRNLFARARVPRVTGTRLGLLAAGVILLIARQDMQPAPVPAPFAKTDLRVPPFDPVRLTLARKSQSVPCGPAEIVSGSMLDCSADNSTTLAEVLPAELETPEDATVTQEFVTRIATGMEKLSAKHREILILRNVKNLSYEEIAEILTISVGTVKSRIARARESLRAKIGDDSK